jgi:hypothetical protein
MAKTHLVSRFTLLAVAASLGACSTPPHTLKTGTLSYTPVAGYQWAHPDSWTDYDVIWRPGSRDPAFPHVYSSAQEGMWSPDDGYDFTAAQGVAVSWRANMFSREHPHVLTGSAENTWRPDDGYVWSDTRNGGVSDFNVRWVPGSRSDRLPHMYAGEEPNHWFPDSGYEIQHRADGSLLAVLLPPPSYSPSDGSSGGGPDYGSVLGYAAAGAAAGQCAQSQPTDGFFKTLVRGACSVVSHVAYHEADRALEGQ